MSKFEFEVCLGGIEMVLDVRVVLNDLALGKRLRVGEKIKIIICKRKSGIGNRTILKKNNNLSKIPTM